MLSAAAGLSCDEKGASARDSEEEVRPRLRLDEAAAVTDGRAEEEQTRLIIFC